MKECMGCETVVEDKLSTCPNCEGTIFMRGAEDAETVSKYLDSMTERHSSKEHVDRGVQLVDEGRHDDAIEEWKKAIELNPLNPNAHGNIGWLLQQHGKNDEAIPWIEKALELNPNLEGAEEVLAKAKAASGKNSGCFVATACYEDPECWEIRVLRMYRDNTLLKSSMGRSLVDIYYTYSPKFANWLSKHDALRLLVRKRILNPIVYYIDQRRNRF